MEKMVLKNKNSIFFYGLLAAVFYLAWPLFERYISVIILAFFISILVEPIYKYFFKLTRKRKYVATTLTFIVVLIGIIIPILIVIDMIIAQTLQLSQDLGDILDSNAISVEQVIKNTNSWLNNIPLVEYGLTQESVTQRLSSIGDEVSSGITSLLGGSGFSSISSGISQGINFVINIVMFFVALASFIPNRKLIIGYLKKLSPLDDRIDEIYLKRIFATSKAMIKGTFLIAVIQSVVTGMVMWLAGVDYVIFWTVLMFFSAIIPMMGTTFVAVPVGIGMILLGNVPAGILVAGFSLLVGAQIDNVLRIYLVPKDAKLHPLLVLVALLGGLAIYGPLGFLYGPIVMILLITTIEIYITYYANSGKVSDIDKKALEE